MNNIDTVYGLYVSNHLSTGEILQDIFISG